MDNSVLLRRTSLEVESVDWTPKLVRTGGASGPLHEEWKLEIRLASETEPVRAAAFSTQNGRLTYSRGWADDPANVIELAVKFFPVNWARSDVVQLAVGAGIRAEVRSGAVKSDPRSATKLLVDPGARARAGIPIELMSIASSGLAIGIFVICAADTEMIRTRWRIRDDLTERLADFSFLATGRRSGWISLS